MELCSAQVENRDATNQHEPEYSYIGTEKKNPNFNLIQGLRHCARIQFYVEIKCQLDATEVFIVDLIACSACFGHHYAHHQELKRIIQWLLPVVFRAVVFSK